MIYLYQVAVLFSLVTVNVSSWGGLGENNPYSLTQSVIHYHLKHISYFARCNDLSLAKYLVFETTQNWRLSASFVPSRYIGKWISASCCIYNNTWIGTLLVIRYSGLEWRKKYVIRDSNPEKRDTLGIRYSNPEWREAAVVIRYLNNEKRTLSRIQNNSCFSLLKSQITTVSRYLNTE